MSAASFSIGKRAAGSGAMFRAVLKTGCEVGFYSYCKQAIEVTGGFGSVQLPPPPAGAKHSYRSFKTSSASQGHHDDCVAAEVNGNRVSERFTIAIAPGGVDEDLAFAFHDDGPFKIIARVAKILARPPQGRQIDLQIDNGLPGAVFFSVEPVNTIAGNAIYAPYGASPPFPSRRRQPVTSHSTSGCLVLQWPPVAQRICSNPAAPTRAT